MADRTNPANVARLVAHLLEIADPDSREQKADHQVQAAQAAGALMMAAELRELWKQLTLSRDAFDRMIRRLEAAADARETRGRGSRGTSSDTTGGAPDFDAAAKREELAAIARGEG